MTQRPLYTPHFPRKSGVLLHPTSLPSAQGVGCLGHGARAFIDFLAAAGFTYWQVCPLGPTGYGDSPYQTFSAFAGNPYLIDLQSIANSGLLSWSALEGLKALPNASVHFGHLYEHFWPLLRLAYQTYQKHPHFIDNEEKEKFEAMNHLWLKPYALFMAFKEYFKGQPWHTWPSAFSSYEQAKASELAQQLTPIADSWVFYEYLFYNQWQAIRSYAKVRGIQIIGDIPIFVAHDSADVWTWPELFDLDASGHLKHQAGVPPDYFSSEGQLWGNPLYHWDKMAAGGYQWWLGRLEKNFALFDTVRLDHFRGFESYWEVPGKAVTAQKGRWKKGPGLELFKAIKKVFPNAQLIAEDLGDLTPAVHELLNQTGFPGMAILQFAFGGAADNPYLPHNHKINSVVYTGSHDNDTSLNAYATFSNTSQDHFRRYLRVNGQEAGWDFIRCALSSVAHTAIIPMQDLLSLKTGARMNFPGRPHGNWSWRYTEDQLRHLYMQGTVDYLKSLNQLYGRN
jgi:4-alpha-glucanotransferase